MRERAPPSCSSLPLAPTAFHYPSEIESADQLPAPVRSKPSSTERFLSLRARIFVRDRSSPRFRARIAQPERSAARNAHVADSASHRRLLIRGVWFSFVLQFNPVESRGIFANTPSLRTPPPSSALFAAASLQYLEAAYLSARARARDSPESSGRIIQPKRQVHCLELLELIWITLV